MNTLVIYRSVSGFTKRYAEWIAEELSATLLPQPQADIDTMKQHDLIIYGGPLHAVGITGVDLIKKNLNALPGVRVLVFAVGASPPKEGLLEELFSNNFGESQRERIKLFYLRGGFDFNKLNLPNRLVMRAMKWKIKTTPAAERSADETGMLQAFDNPVDFTARENIEPLVSWAKALQQA
jgi:flavodoxin